MDVLTLDAQPRELGTRAARAVRRQEEVPCVLYGPHQEPVHFRLPVLSLRPLVYTSRAHRVVITVDGKSYECIPRAIDFHPVTDLPEHVDFYVLTEGEEISMTVPVELVGAAPGVKAGGVLSQLLYDLDIRCLPKDIPGSVEIDVSGLEIGDSLHVSDIEIANATIDTEGGRAVVTVSAPTAEEPEEDVDDELLLDEDAPSADEDAESGDSSDDGDDEG